MIDPITAIATAQATIAGIRKAIQVGKDASTMVKEFTSLFAAADAVHKAANDIEATGKGDMEQAAAIVQQRHELKREMEELKHRLIYTGYPELWDQMLSEYIRIRKAREKREREERLAQAKRRKELVMLMLYGVTSLIFVGLLVGFIYVLMQVN